MILLCSALAATMTLLESLLFWKYSATLLTELPSNTISFLLSLLAKNSIFWALLLFANLTLSFLISPHLLISIGTLYLFFFLSLLYFDLFILFINKQPFLLHSLFI